MTPDLQRLQQSSDTLAPIIAQLELELIDDPHWGEPSDTSYLSEKERANPDIRANVEAMAETNKLIVWFGRDAEGFVGMWRGPTQRPVESAPVVRLDTEGQYSIVAPTIPDYIAMSVPDDEFASVREVLVGAGFQVGNNPDAIWDALGDVEDDPNEYRDALYRQNKVRLGAGPGDGEEEEEEEEEERSDRHEEDGDEEEEGTEPSRAPAAAEDEEEPAAHGGDDEDDEEEDLASVADDDDDDDFFEDDDEDGESETASRVGEGEEARGGAQPDEGGEEEDHAVGERRDHGEEDTNVDADEEESKEESEDEDEDEAPAPAEKPEKPAKKPPAKKPPAKKPPAKKPPAKKPPAKKPAKKAPAKKPPAKKKR